MANQSSVSIVVPLFNEKELAGDLVKIVYDFSKSVNLDSELIVVDDGSNDGSSLLLDELTKTYPFLRAIHLKKNIGIGRALKTGFASAKKDIIFYTDADLPVDINVLMPGKAIIDRNEADMVIGNRMGRRESFLRRFYTGIFNLMIRSLFKIKLHDINCAMKIFRRSIINDIKLNADGPFIDTELVLKMRNNGFRILELKVKSMSRRCGCSKFASPERIVGTIFRMILEMVKSYPELRKNTNGKKDSH
ncbi:MAG: glycosyltransferase family 2 protein [Candidatus Omnitrophota bacterium]